MFEVASNYVKKLNKQATFVDEKRHKEHGKSHYFLLAYDELIQRPKIRDFPGKRKQPVVACLMPDHWTENELGKIMITIGQQMCIDSGQKDFCCSTEREPLYKYLFGNESSTQSRKKKKDD